MNAFGLLAAAILCSLVSDATAEPIRFVGEGQQTGTLQFRRTTDAYGHAYQFIVNWEYDLTIDGTTISFDAWRANGYGHYNNAFQNPGAELSFAFSAAAKGVRNLTPAGDGLYDIEPYSMAGDVAITYRDADEDLAFTVQVGPWISSVMKQQLDMANFPQTMRLTKTDQQQSPMLMRPSPLIVVNTNYEFWVCHLTRPNDSAILMSSFVNGGDVDADGDIDGKDFLYWQRGFGTVFDDIGLSNWTEHFGTPAGLAVPEPTVWTMSLAYLTLGVIKRVKKGHILAL